MLVTFSCSAHADITMFGDVAVDLLKLMGHSGTVPGAIRAEDVEAALSRLRAGLAAREAESVDSADSGQDDEEDEEPVVTLSRRALPLISLLEAARAKNRDVMWDGNH